jgi:acyl carrier protein
MLPAVITVLPSLPRTNNGKIDRKALPPPAFAGRPQGRKFTPPETPGQRKLAAIWAEVLKIEKVSITDSIFELGADSLLIFRISARAGREGLSLRPEQIFQHRTIANLSKALEKAGTINLEGSPAGPSITAVSREKYRRANS